MTIKELETRTGMTRANIRFYEQEGLLSPARQPNGYRDYSDADREALEKIKLLRALHLDLNTIRALQKGEADLTRSLDGCLGGLDADREALDRASRVCRELRDAGTDYAGLDPIPWLEELERDPVPDSPRFAPPDDRAPTPERYLHPWRRYFARAADLALCGLPWAALCFLVFHWNPPSNLWTRLLNTYAAYGVMLVAEPLLLHFWGTTPGKAVFGITIRDAAGEKLSHAQAQARTLAVFGRGMGWGIPIYRLYRLWKSFNAKEDNPEDWAHTDDGTPERYGFANDAGWRCVACAGLFLLVGGLSVLIFLQSLMPPNHGALTEAEFYENCNFYMDYLDLNGNRRLDSAGNWVEPPSNGVVVAMEGIGGTRTVRYSVTVDENGAVTGAAVELAVSGHQLLWVGHDDAAIAALALAGSRANCLNFHPYQWVELVQGEQWDYDVTRDGLRLTRRTQLEHLNSDNLNTVVTVQDGQTGTVAQRFEIAVAAE